MAGLMIGCIIMKVQVCVCWFFIQGSEQPSVSNNFNCIVQNVDRFITRFMSEFNLGMYVVKIGDEVVICHESIS